MLATEILLRTSHISGRPRYFQYYDLARQELACSLETSDVKGQIIRSADLWYHHTQPCTELNISFDEQLRVLPISNKSRYW